MRVPAAADFMRRRQIRWAVPAAAVAAVAMVIAGTEIAGAQAAPRLPARTAAQLLAAVANPAGLPPAMTAVVRETASLGLPDLPGAASSGPLSALSLLSGTNTFKIWYDGPTRVRVAVPVSLGETDLRRDGRNVWLWDSKTDQATHYVLPDGAAGGPARSVPPSLPSLPGPQQLVRQILAAVGATTTVGLQRNVMVAGQAAYQLSLAPKTSRSLVGQVRIAIDARDSLPLRVQVFARGAASPAFAVGYTSLSFARPAASNFAFAPPPGARVKTVTLGAGPLGAGPLGAAPGVAPFISGPVSVGGLGSAAPGTRIIAQGGSPPRFVAGAKALPVAIAKQMAAAFAKQLPRSLTKAQRAALVKSFESRLEAKQPAGVPAGSDLPGSWIAFAPLSASPQQGGAAQSPGPAQTVFSGSAASSSAAAAPRVMGKGWLSVAVLPAAAGGALQGTIGALEGAATPVHGFWGSGRLLRTSLLSILFTDGGEMLIGATVPSVLYSDAAHVR